MEFVEFFTQMHWAVIMLVCVGLVLLIIEAILPGFGVCGITGILSGIAAVVCEAIFTKSLFDVFFLIFLVLVVFTLFFVVVSLMLSKGPLKKTPLVETGTAIPEHYGKLKNLDELVGKQGEVVSACKPVGKAVIDGKTYTVHSTQGTINVGEKIKVVGIKNTTINIECLRREK